MTEKGINEIRREARVELVKGLRSWLGESGKRFFKWCYEKHGSVSPVYSEKGIPHAVHFVEGMQVRNFLRSCHACAGWTDHDFDDKWAELVTEALNIEVSLSKD